MESKERFTPGPWHIDDTHRYFLCNKKGKPVADCGFICLSGEEITANCDFIAAAPELYECLKTECAECRVENSPEDEECRDCKVRKVLAKARGEKSKDADD